jgi:hypothetical protein
VEDERVKSVAIAAAIFGLCSGVYIVVREGPATLRHPLRSFLLPPDLTSRGVGWRWYAHQDRAIAYLWRAVFLVCLGCLFAVGIWWIAMRL